MLSCHRVNQKWHEAENQQGDRLTIKPQTFCYLKEIKPKTMKIQRKTQQWVTITQLRLTDKNRLLTKNNTNILSRPQNKMLIENQ